MEKIKAMIGGVRINGRHYSQGCCCLYMPVVPRRWNQDGVGGRAGASESHKVGIINMFYVVGDTVMVDVQYLTEY